MDKREETAERLFGEALDLPRDQRESFLERACAGKPALRRMVEDLLDQNDRLSGFLSEPIYTKPKSVATTTDEIVVNMGTRLLERYRIESVLGSGGMGVVYRAKDEKLDREVAIKMLQPGVLSGQESRTRFQREARALAKVNHPHIAAVYDVIEEGGVDFIVMELVTGESLAARPRRGSLSIQEGTAIALQVAEALEEAHEQGVIHRDLKPANVMLTPKGQVKVLDFGLARLLGPVDGTQITLESGVMGTPVYMSPEQAIGQRADARSDLWALGVTYYEALAGEAPFKGTNSLEVLRAVTDEMVRPLRELRRDVPALAEQIAARALEKDPDLRYQHARDLATDLRRVLRDLEPTRGGTSAALALKTRRSRSQRKLAIATPFALIAIAGLAFWLRPAIPAPKVIGMKQITDDGTPKVDTSFSFGQHLMTDGSRIYYEVQLAHTSILKNVSTEGGGSEIVPITLQDHAAMDLRGGSDLLSLGDPVASTNDAGAVWHIILPGGQARRIGGFQANDATWSPDGESVFWTRNGKISVSRRDGSETRTLLTTDRFAGDIAFSPDGTRMRYSVIDEHNNSTIWEAGLDGSHPHPVFADPSGLGSHCCGMWTPDGKYYVFQSDRGGVINVRAVRERRHWWEKVNAAPVPLTVGPMKSTLPLPSADGKQIFFVGSASRGELERYDTRRKEFIAVLPRLSAEHVAYSRDGTHFAYVAVQDSTLWVSRRDGSDQHQITFAPMLAALPVWSPDGKQIAFMGQEPGQKWHIYLSGVQPGNTPVALTTGDVADFNPDWSPDGRSIAFGGLSGTRPIEILDLVSHKITPLPVSEGMIGERWSPDGKFIVATTGGPGPLMLYTFATQSWRPLGPAQAGWPTWSHDGKCIYYADDSGPGYPGYLIDRLCLADLKPQLVIDMQQGGPLMPGRFGIWFGLTPDDSILALRDAGMQEIYSLQMDWR
jgi:serine/threonine protein kinase/Tol biopolymer transport system component